jgi:hypothetical protein
MVDDMKKTLKDYFIEAERRKKPNEPEGTPKPTQDKEHDPFSAFDNLFAPKQDHLPAQHNEPRQEPPHHNEPQAGDPRQHRASQADTQRATSGIHHPGMRDLLNRMRDIEADPDDPGYPQQDQENAIQRHVDNHNLPTVAGQNLRAAGVQQPQFHKVANLPGNMLRGIRTLGRHLFRSLTHTPTDDIWMIANLNGQGPNSREEVNSVAHWAREHGEDVGAGNIDFDATIPGYQADIHQYTAGGIRWLVVRDQFGEYIYSWPENESVTPHHTAAVGHQHTTPQIANR